MNLASALQGRGNSSTVEPFAREAYTLIRAAFGDGSPHAVEAADVLATVWLDLGHYADAETVLLESHAALAQRPTVDAARTQRVAQRLAEVYDAWGRPEQAAAWHARASETQSTSAATTAPAP